MSLGQICLVLHGHLPWVHAPQYPEFLEEDWLFEAVSGTYLPLLDMLDRLEAEAIPSPITLGFTPPLLEMLRAPALVKKIGVQLTRRLKLATLEARRLAGQQPQSAAAAHYLERAERARTLWRLHAGDLPAAFAHHVRSGRVTAMASCATHAVLPLVATRAARAAQIRVGCTLFEEVFGAAPQGFWLPECAYEPGIDALLAEQRLRWTVVETHAITDAWPDPEHGPLRPLELPSGVVALARDPTASRQVWAQEVGYPGDPLYRELYRDLGFDGEYTYVKRFLHADGVRRNLGFKYHRVTGRVELHEKAAWNVEHARQRATVHARHFLSERRNAAHAHGAGTVMTAPYDMELFGHWWYEGPWFLEALFRNAAEFAPDLQFAHPGAAIESAGTLRRADPPLSTWGEDGYLKVWLNEGNAWILRHQQETERRVLEACSGAAAADPTTERLRMQLLRELFLLQSSDWGFILTKGTADHYARQRVCNHVARILGLLEALKDPAKLDEAWFSELAAEDSIFPGLAGDPFSAAFPLKAARIGHAPVTPLA
ncbi:MAG: DUF1957 domain-containing protein [Planctomycetes bacterium]|nr:DUF1957 domain-containing protein [Planctomycetota bacterium]